MYLLCFCWTLYKLGQKIWPIFSCAVCFLFFLFFFFTLKPSHKYQWFVIHKLSGVRLTSLHLPHLLPSPHLSVKTKHSCFHPTNHPAMDTSCCPLDNCGWKQPPTFSPWDVVAPSCCLLTILHGESRLQACQYASNIYCLTHGLWGEIGKEAEGGRADYTHPPDSVLIPESFRKYTHKNISGAGISLLITN